jgi:hypothetical protein
MELKNVNPNGDNVVASNLAPKAPRVFQWKNGQNYPLLKNTPIIIFSTTF